MSGKAFELESTDRPQGASKQRISKALRNATREARSDILNSYGYQALWLGQVSRQQYVSQLHAHWAIRRALETTFESLDGEFRVRNLANNEEKVFAVRKYVTTPRHKAHLLEADLLALVGTLPKQPLPAKTQELIDYTAKVSAVYSVGLLGVLYVLEEAVAYAGPLLAGNLDRELKLQGEGTRYLRGNGQHKQDLWEFRRSLDLITDFQTQVNVVTAASIAYSMYRDLIDPRASLAPPRSAKPN